MNDDKEDFWSTLDKIRQAYQEHTNQYEKETDEWWNNLEYEDKLRAFYSVCKRIYQGDVVERTSYRGVLYDVFEFDMDSYGLGLECKYMDLHNFIQNGMEKEKEDE